MDLSLNLFQSLGNILCGDVFAKFLRNFSIGFYRVLFVFRCFPALQKLLRLLIRSQFSQKLDCGFF